MFTTRSYVRWAGPLAMGLVLLGVGPSPAHAAAAPVHDDFNGDGYQDLVVGAPWATVGGLDRAGEVAVMYGGPHGLSTTRRTVITRATSGIPGSPVKNQSFGQQVSKGDLNGDGYADLVIGVGWAGTDSVIVWGGPKGLSGTGTSIPASNTQTGDFDGDGKLDLALFRTKYSQVDDPSGTTGTIWKGPVTRTGTSSGTTAIDPDGYLKVIDIWDGSAGDVNGDGRDDLALEAYCGEGYYCVQLYVSSPSGLVPTDEPLWGSVTALGDVNGDGYADLVTGDGANERIAVAYGSKTGLTPSSTWKFYSQNTPGVPGAKESGDNFGGSVAVGDITGDGIDDVAVGASAEGLGTGLRAGMVNILRGSRTGLTGTGAQGFTQNTPGVPGTAERNDDFGDSVQLLDINGNGYADLAAAAANENSGDGAVWELRGRPTGLVTDAALVFGPKGLGAAYAKARFGYEVD
ncbi:FG-GAP-like repeat-containing protein [Streptomyces sp. NPDC005538]|uniref:FG-GAP-like repeat-containing protein n=1 Tax=unclassified Streptomyces TaxID=2593676 RepID=UPI0033AC7625